MDATTTSSNTTDGTSLSTAAAEFRRLIVAAGQELREARQAEDADRAAAILERLLGLKKQFAEVAGVEYQSWSSRAAKRARQASVGTDASDPESMATVNMAKKSKKIETSRFKAAADSMALPPPASSFPAWQPRDFFRFEVIHRSHKPGSRARIGRIHTPHGIIDTPAFVPVGTNGALKAIDERQGREAGTKLMFCNTYHLLVHPGPDVIRQAGGLHNFMQHEGAIITDSGGFQVARLNPCFFCRGCPTSQWPEPAQRDRRLIPYLAFTCASLPSRRYSHWEKLLRMTPLR